MPSITRPLKVAVIGGLLHAIVVSGGGAAEKVTAIGGFNMEQYYAFAALCGVSEFVVEVAQQFLEEKIPFLKQLGDLLPHALTGGIVFAGAIVALGASPTSALITGGLASGVSYLAKKVVL